MKNIPNEIQKQLEEIGAVLVDRIPHEDPLNRQWIMFPVGKYLGLSKSLEIPRVLFHELFAVLQELRRKNDSES